METYIGLDGHSTTCTFVSLNAQGKVLDEAKVATTESSILRFVRAQKGNTRLVFEESGLSKWLFALLKKEVDELVVCHPGLLGKKQGAKNDRNDALHLANELRCGHVVAVFHEQSELMDLRALVGAYVDVVREIVRTKNRYKALFRGEALPTHGKTIYYAEERISELSGKVDQFVAKNLFQQISNLESVKATYLEQFETNMKRHPVLKLLDSVPGIDIIRAHVIASIVCTGDRFRNKHKLWAYAMLVKHIEESDGRVYGKRIHYGRIELKEAFLGIAETAIARGTSSLRKHYDCLRTKGTDHADSKLSVARKVAAICLMMKKKVKYDDNFDEKKERLTKQKKN